MNRQKIICIYHGNCADGFTAAWAVWRKFPEAEFFAATYGNQPPDVKGKDVIIVDFCYSPAILDEMSEKAASILILDHHKSAHENLKATTRIGSHPPVIRYETKEWDWDRITRNNYQDRCEGIPSAVIYAFFDMERSGARIAWDFFHPGEKVPQLVLHVEDRDLWRFKIGRTREIQAYIFANEYDFKTWNCLAEMAENPETHKQMVFGGEAIEMKHHKDIKELVGVSKRRMSIGGQEVWCVNLPYTMASDACHLLCSTPMYPSGSGELKTSPDFGASYWDGPDGRTFSLRSIGEFDVSEIAKKYGGGGHKNAAGFRMPIGWEGDE